MQFKMLMRRNKQSQVLAITPETEEDHAILNKLLIGHPDYGTPLTEEELQRLEYLQSKGTYVEP